MDASGRVVGPVDLADAHMLQLVVDIRTFAGGKHAVQGDISAVLARGCELASVPSLDLAYSN